MKGLVNPGQCVCVKHVEAGGSSNFISSWTELVRM